ncbi:monocarboxylate transporter 9-like [Uloborus diversus]|uniref:monocarboxylate transporter 9-like n=1 Tax=Uloborus diversus TaxID=327109 RepID=UPI002409B986|nr:monocarboxylate transporter 9-like [Uloborus diversus]
MGYSEGPDKGHAWAIAIAAAVITMILSGISKMVGILYVAVIDTYGVSRQQATLPFTFRKALRCLAGPVVGIMGQRYGVRAVTLAGGFVAALGAALCFVAPTVEWMAFCWGGVHGLGESFANTLFQVVVNQYFVKYRSTSSGIAMSGACIGSVCFSFLIEELRDAYGLQGTFLVLSGVILNVLPAAILLRPPSWIGKNGTSKPKNFQESVKQRPRMYMIPDDYVKSNADKRMSTISLNPSMLEKNQILSAANLPAKANSTTNLVANLEKKLEGEKGYNNLAFAVENEKQMVKPRLEKQLSIQNIFTTSKESLYESIPSSYELNEKNLKAETPKTKQINKDDNAAKPQSFTESFKMIGRLYKNPLYLLVCATQAAYVLLFIPLMMSVVDYGRDKGLPETVGKYLIHATAVGDILGRLCFGWVTDKEFITIPHYVTMTLILEGVFILFLPSTSSLAGFLIILAFYCMTAGSMLVRMPVLVLKHVKKEEQSIAMGCYGFVSGLVPFTVPSLIGYFRDNVGSYDGMYYLMGSLSIVAGLMWLFEPMLARLNERMQNPVEDEVKV